MKGSETMNKRIYILGGGTFFDIRPHDSLAARAFGTTATKLADLCKEIIPDLDVVLALTKMADRNGWMVTNADVKAYVEGTILPDPHAKIVFFNVAMANKASVLDAMGLPSPSGKNEPRLDSKRTHTLELTSDEKIINLIRKTRKDIFLIGFKTTSNETEGVQYAAGLNMLKANSCNLVLANDIGVRRNMVITPEEAKYHVTYDRDEALRNLVEMAKLRSHLTFTRSTVVGGRPVHWNSDLVPTNLRDVVNYCVERGAYKAFRGATVGHFACKLSDTEFLTSIRKSNFNDIANNGLVKIRTDGPDTVLAYGARPSVGGQSQRIVFKDHPGMDCIVHFHCPIKEGSKVPQVSQREYECGSHECGKNTSTGLKAFHLRDTDANWMSGQENEWYTINVVYLQEHGPNIVFHHDTPAHLITRFIEENFDLEGKTGGYIP